MTWMTLGMTIHLHLHVYKYLYAFVPSSVAEKVQRGIPDTNAKEPIPVSNIALGVTPEKSERVESGAEMVGMPLNSSVKEKTTKMVVDKLNGNKSDVKSHPTRTSEPVSDSSAKESRNCFTLPKLEPCNPGHSNDISMDFVDEDHSHQGYSETASDTFSSTNYMYDNHTAQKTSSELPTNKSTPISNGYAESTAKQSFEEEYDPGYNSSQVEGSDSVNCPSGSPTLGTHSTIENVGPSHTTDNTQQTNALPSNEASEPQVETNQDTNKPVHVLVAPPQNYGTHTRNRDSAGDQRHTHCLDQQNYESKPSVVLVLLEVFKSLDKNVAICLLCCSCVIVIVLCILLVYILAYHTFAVYICIGFIVYKNK